MVSVYVYGAVPPLAVMPTLTLPLTVAPAAGDEKPAVNGPGPLFCTVTGILREPVLLEGSRTVAVSVVAPLGVPLLIHGRVTGPLDVSLPVATVWPPAVSVYALVPAAALSTHMVTQ